MRVEVRARTCGRREVAMSRQGARSSAECLCGPCERHCSAGDLGLGERFFVEVTLADNQEVSGRVVVGRSVARELRRPKLVDVSVAVDANVVRDVDPAVAVLVVALVLTQARRCMGVIA